MGLTDFHAKYLAYELTRRCASDDLEKLAPVLADARVDLNPHQVDAALFAFRSPFSKGAILADEVGLGKTIEAALLLAQKWAERKRHLLVILPANLRKQWAQELADKFYLPTAILETRSFNEAVRGGKLNPFDQDGIVLCSYQFARNKEPYVRQIAWDLVVIDEAHRLRNVYKGSSKIAQAIKNAVAPFPKVLLTATPLQNSLLELYGLVSIVDEMTFGDLPSFRARFTRLSGADDFAELKERLRTVCTRTLRRQVLQYVRYTSRHAIVQEFAPGQDEQQLYDQVSRYLQRPRLFALPASQRQLVTLILRKLLASSTFAIAGTLHTLIERLEEQARLASEAQLSDGLAEHLRDDYEGADELEDEWDGEDDAGPSASRPRLTAEELNDLQAELADLREFHALAESIFKNSKGEALLVALRRGFEEAQSAQQRAGAKAQAKAVIFTESRRTQQYLLTLLDGTEFAGKAIVFNGTNTDQASKAIYARWLERHQDTDRVSGSPSADMRAALVDYFRDEAAILIATEAAAEGINLQFCNLVVNYDLPWNPQRIEQRIGRCHRYGQSCDVVVVNFVNLKNAADKRVYELLDEKLQLFSGVFGASDEVLGAIESGVDFEKRIASIYQLCRTPAEIEREFDALQEEMEVEISQGQREAREKLLDNFDQEVIEKVRLHSEGARDRYNEQLWQLTQYVLANHANFAATERAFVLRDNPFEGEPIHPGPYRMGRDVTDANTYRVGHPLARRVVGLGRTLEPAPANVAFSLTDSGMNVAALEPFIGERGVLVCALLSAHAVETEERVLLAAVTDQGAPLDESQCRRLFDLPGLVTGALHAPLETEEATRDALDALRQRKVEEIEHKGGRFFDTEVEKVDRWLDDRLHSERADLDDLAEQITRAKSAVKTAPTIPEKLERQREQRALETKARDAKRAYESAAEALQKKRDAKLDELGKSLAHDVQVETLFTLRWTLT